MLWKLMFLSTSWAIVLQFSKMPAPKHRWRASPWGCRCIYVTSNSIDCHNSIEGGGLYRCFHQLFPSLRWQFATLDAKWRVCPGPWSRAHMSGPMSPGPEAWGRGGACGGAGGGAPGGTDRDTMCPSGSISGSSGSSHAHRWIPLEKWVCLLKKPTILHSREVFPWPDRILDGFWPSWLAGLNLNLI